MIVKNKTGVWGEVFAARYLRDNKYKILTTNYSTRYGEIDIIAEKNETVCFIEVKTRGLNPMFSPSEAVDGDKQRRIKICAEAFISGFEIREAVQFDVCEVWLNDNFTLSEINYIENAF